VLPKPNLQLTERQKRQAERRAAQAESEQAGTRQKPSILRLFRSQN